MLAGVGLGEGNEVRGKDSPDHLARSAETGPSLAVLMYLFAPAQDFVSISVSGTSLFGHPNSIF